MLPKLLALQLLLVAAHAMPSKRAIVADPEHSAVKLPVEPAAGAAAHVPANGTAAAPAVDTDDRFLGLLPPPPPFGLPPFGPPPFGPPPFGGGYGGGYGGGGYNNQYANMQMAGSMNMGEQMGMGGMGMGPYGK